MSHNVSYYWFGRTQYIPRFGGVLQELGILLGWCLAVKKGCVLLKGVGAIFLKLRAGFLIMINYIFNQ